MELQTRKHSTLITEIVGMLLTRFERLPTNDQSLIAIATVEAAAWIVAMETTSADDKSDERRLQTLENSKRYAEIFETILAKEIDTFYDQE
ncbi:MAG: hypothetical protein JKY60_17665 [Kordiimonadaceae bacterium]|nr:hypothetical protein [Kordiimonadaceae bacterium]